MLCMGREWGKTRSWSDRSPKDYASFVPCSKRLRVGRYCRGVVAWAVPLGEALAGSAGDWALGVGAGCTGLGRVGDGGQARST
jgi:hypothetical protein